MSNESHYSGSKDIKEDSSEKVIPKEDSSEKVIPKDGNQEMKSNRVKILQWNVLAQSFAQGFDNYVSDEHLTWKHRSNLIIGFISKYSPDIITLQELDKYLQLKEILVDYDSYFTRKLRNKLNEEKENEKKGASEHEQGQLLTDGCAIFFRKSVFEAKNKGFYYMYPGSQVVQNVRLIHKSTGKKFDIINTHLKAKEPFREVRCIQVAEAMAFLAKYIDFSKEYEQGNKLKKEKTPVVFCGDFNDIPNSIPIKYIESKMKLVFFNNNELNEDFYTTFKSRKGVVVKRTIDYIFYKNITLIDRSSKKVDELCPNEHYPSDHMFLCAEFEF